jgi:hypothetical protein
VPEEREARSLTMDRIIRCDCGYVVQGSTDEELIANARAHIGQMHPDIVEQVDDADLLAMAEEIA